MGLQTVYANYKFKTKFFQILWQDLLDNTFNHMKLYYYKQLSMQQVLIFFKKAFKITPQTLFKTQNSKLKNLAIFILTNYSNEDFLVIAKKFNLPLNHINLIYKNKYYKKIFTKDLEIFFNIFKTDFLYNQKVYLSLQEKMLYIFDS